MASIKFKELSPSYPPSISICELSTLIFKMFCPELIVKSKTEELIRPETVGNRFSSPVKSCNILDTKAQFIAIDSLVISL